MTKILIIEDDTSLAEILSRNLEQKNYIVEATTSGEHGTYLAQSNKYNLILLDLNLPDCDGLEVCQKLRDSGNQTPIIMLTERENVADRIQGLDSGADDYLPKPFSLKELEARVRSVIRRHRDQRRPTIEAGSFCLDPRNCQFSMSGQKKHLSPKLFAIMEILMLNPNEVVPREEIIEAVWGETVDAMLTNTLDVHICELRKALGDKRYIQTLTNSGFKLHTDIDR